MDVSRWVDPRVKLVRLAGVRAYLARFGYAERAHDGAHRFESAATAFVLPAEDDATFARAVVELLTTLSETEDRHPVALLDDVLRAQADARKPGLRLLWVENHATFVRMARRQFLAAHDVTVAPTLAAARRELEAGTFAAVLLDHDLDDGKGTALIEAIKARTPAPLIVAVSALETGNQALVRAGANVVCPKTQFARIEAVLREALG